MLYLPTLCKAALSLPPTHNGQVRPLLFPMQPSSSSSPSIPFFTLQQSLYSSSQHFYAWENSSPFLFTSMRTNSPIHSPPALMHSLPLHHPAPVHGGFPPPCSISTNTRASSDGHRSALPFSPLLLHTKGIVQSTQRSPHHRMSSSNVRH